MGRKQLNHVQYKRNIHPDFVDKMDKCLNNLRQTEKKINYTEKRCFCRFNEPTTKTSMGKSSSDH